MPDTVRALIPVPSPDWERGPTKRGTGGGGGGDFGIYGARGILGSRVSGKRTFDNPYGSGRRLVGGENCKRNRISCHGVIAHILIR